ncbi:MAG: PAS domain S-box protein, partial [Spirochaetales bacterium]|nr:PAS domain S-box protein [Spirochaetales bacterium]
YKFLILEDVETDAELIMDQVRVADIVCNFKCTDNEDDFKRLIDEFKPDLILSDYSLPAYDGMSALKYVLEHSPDIPVILVTGSINEETAVACMRTGAVDYVLKDKMSRLGLAVKTALENKDIKLERAKVREKLKKSELYYRFILKCMNDEIVVISRDLIITDINDSILRFIEGKREDIIGQPYYKVLHNFESPCFYNGVNCFLSKVIENGKPERYQRKLITQDGKKVHMDVMISPLYDQNNQISHVIESYRDITDQVKNLNEIKKLSIAVEQSPSSVIMMDKEGRIEYVNPMFTKVTGYESQEVQGENIGIISSGSTSMEEREQVHQDVLNGNNRTFIFENRRKDGSSFSVEA